MDIKIGLLPMYLKLYDDSIPGMRGRINSFAERIAGEFGKLGMKVESAPVCRVREEFAAAVRHFEKAGVDVLVTLHLAYSPSLESADVLASTYLPVVLLDTTPAYGFGPCQEKEEIMYNHGIHGVQDICNLLVRKGKKFLVEAGHWEKSDVLARAAEDIRAAKLARTMESARVGRIGDPFEGMGDFNVPEEELKSDIGIETVRFEVPALGALAGEIGEQEISDEVKRNEDTLQADGLDTEVHRRTARACLALRRLVEREKLGAFTMNFMAVDGKWGLEVVPFLEASNLMAKGIGYAGEGDVLTAALVGTLASVYAETTFVEMFCPDWENGSIFLSHMGEFNLRLAAEKPLLTEMDFPYTDAGNPAVAFGRYKPGRAVLVNLAPSGGGRYTLIVAPVNMLDVDGEDRMKYSVHGWLKPGIPLEGFLQRFSVLGGTHHSALVYGGCEGEIMKFGQYMGWNVQLIG